MTDILARFPGIGMAEIRAEVARELDQRRRVYPDRVAKGRMTERDARFQIAAFESIARDVAAIADNRHAPDAACSWADKLAVLRREVALRLQFYPQWVTKGRITVTAARAQANALECLLALYEEGWGWTPANGTSPAWGRLHPTLAEADSRTEWRDHWRETEALRARTNDNAQERMAL